MPDSPKQGPWPRTSHRWGWWRGHWRVARDVLSFISRHTGTSLLVWLLVGIALALPASLMLLQTNLSRLAADWGGGRPSVSVYMELGALNTAELAAQLERRAEVAAVALTSQDEALAEFTAYTGLADALTGLERNPLPASLRVTFAAGAQADALEAVAASMRAADGVADVVVERTWLERINAISRLASALGLVFGALFGVGAILVTATTVRFAIDSQLDELKVMKLVGASDAQLRRPFLYCGALYGAGGGLMAAMLVSLGLIILEAPLLDLLGSFDQTLALGGFDVAFVAALVGLGSALGMAGAVLAVRQRLAALDVM